MTTKFVYSFDLYSRNIEKRSDSFTILIDYATKQYEATISLCSKIDGSNLYQTHLSKFEQHSQSNCRVHMIIDTELDTNTLDSIHTTLKNKYNFIYKPTTFYQTQIINKFNTFDEVKNKFASFILINQEYSDIFRHYYDVNRIKGTIEANNRRNVLLPFNKRTLPSEVIDPSSTSSTITTSTTSTTTFKNEEEFCWLTKNSEFIHYIDFTKKHCQEVMPQYSIVINNDQLLCCKNNTPPTLIDMMVYLIPTCLSYIYYSVNAYVGFFEYVFNGVIYYIWLSSKHIIQPMLSTNFIQTTNYTFNEFKLDDQKVIVKMFKSFINLFGLSDYSVANNSTIYYIDDDVLLFCGTFPLHLDRTHSNNISKINIV